MPTTNEVSAIVEKIVSSIARMSPEKRARMVAGFKSGEFPPEFAMPQEIRAVIRGMPQDVRDKFVQLVEMRTSMEAMGLTIDAPFGSNDLPPDQRKPSLRALAYAMDVLAPDRDDAAFRFYAIAHDLTKGSPNAKAVASMGLIRVALSMDVVKNPETPVATITNAITAWEIRPRRNAGDLTRWVRFEAPDHVARAEGDPLELMKLPVELPASVCTIVAVYLSCLGSPEQAAVARHMGDTVRRWFLDSILPVTLGYAKDAVSVVEVDFDESEGGEG